MPIRDQIAAWRLAYQLDANLTDDEVIAAFAAIECLDAVERPEVIAACRLRLDMPLWLEQILDALGDATACYEDALHTEAERLTATAVRIFAEHFGELATARPIYRQLLRGLVAQLAEAKARATTPSASEPATRAVH